MRIGEGSHQKKIKNYRLINQKIPAVFVFWPFKSVKRAKKTRFSKIGLKPTQKAKRMTQMSTQPFWGVFREVFGLRS